MNAHTRAEALRLVDEIEDEASTRHECARQVDLQLKAVLLGCNKLRALLSASDDVPDAAAWPSVHDLTPAREREDPQFSAWRNRMPDKHWARYDLSAVRLGFELGRAVFASPPPPNGETK